MNDIELLARRRELLVLSAGLQRANLQARLDRLQADPMHVLFDLAVGQLRRTSVRAALAVALAEVLVRIWRRARATH